MNNFNNASTVHDKLLKEIDREENGLYAYSQPEKDRIEADKLVKEFIKKYKKQHK
ncbi:hypothetical protein [Radiobacillus sp. PE A8.2]|uniref:hypothetical protein n=1 Tax=Radiobacillus sp. PE A8.2 TaxID=3380349 RepID=UPI00388D56D3